MKGRQDKVPRNIVKSLPDIYVEKHKTLPNDWEENLCKWREIHMFMFYETQYLKDVIYPQMNLQSLCNSSRDLTVIFHGIYHTV